MEPYRPRESASSHVRRVLLAAPRVAGCATSNGALLPASERRRRHLDQHCDRCRAAFVISREITPGSFGSAKWSTPGLSVRLKWKHIIALHAPTAPFVRSSWL